MGHPVLWRVERDAGSLHCGTDDEAVRSFGRDDDAFSGLRESGSCFARGLWLIEGRRFALRANAHLSDDQTVAKMGHPAPDTGLDVRSRRGFRGDSEVRLKPHVRLEAA